MGQSVWTANVHCTTMSRWGVNPMANWRHTMAPELGTTKLVDAQQDHMGQYSCFASVYCTNTENSGVIPICTNWRHTKAPELNTTNLVGVQQNHTTTEQYICPVGVHCTFKGKWGVNFMGARRHLRVASKISTTIEMDAQPKDFMRQPFGPATVHCTVKGKSSINHMRKNAHRMMVDKSDTTNENITQPFPPNIARSHHCVTAQYMNPTDGGIYHDQTKVDQLYTHVTAVYIVLLHKPSIPHRAHMLSLNHTTPEMVGNAWDRNQDSGYAHPSQTRRRTYTDQEWNDWNSQNRSAPTNSS